MVVITVHLDHLPLHHPVGAALDLPFVRDKGSSCPRLHLRRRRLQMPRQSFRGRQQAPVVFKHLLPLGDQLPLQLEQRLLATD